MKSTKVHSGIASVWASKGKKRRGLRALPKGEGYAVHVTSRAVQQRFLFGEPEKQRFVELMEAWAAFSGIEVLTHCQMSNHFHLFLWVPKREEVSLEELRRRIRLVWPGPKVDQWERLHQESSPEQKKEMERVLTERMFDLPALMRVLKQSFSTWYNRRHGCCGTLWESRYRSMVVKNTREGFLRVATYIDLNPVRAGICQDPRAYAWSGYGQAESGNASRRRGLERLLQMAGIPGATVAQEVYRIWLYRMGEAAPDSSGAGARRKKRKGFSSFEVLKEYELFMEKRNASNS